MVSVRTMYYIKRNSNVLSDGNLLIVYRDEKENFSVCLLCVLYFSLKCGW